MTPIVFEGGEPGEAQSHQAGIMGLVSARAFAPGQPLQWRLQLGDETPLLQGKSIGSKRREDGRFDVRVRLLNLRRSDRELLEALF